MYVKSRTRSLTTISHKLMKNSRILETTLSDMLAPGNALNVLEVGFGWGCALLELAWQFRDAPVTFYGVDLTQQPPMEKREDLRSMACQFDLIPASAIKDFALPYLFFYDATRLHFDDESMDLIYSAVTIRFMERKAEFLEEVCRVLRPGGMAFLQIGESNWDYPYSRICDPKVLTPYTTRFVLKHDDHLIPLPVYVKLFEKDAFRFTFTTTSRCVIVVSKLTSHRLALHLDFNPHLSMPTLEFSYRDRLGRRKDGFRSVYDVRPEYYQALFAPGLLSREQLRTDVQMRSHIPG